VIPAPVVTPATPPPATPPEDEPVVTVPALLPGCPE
jgi:hypothetical protein